MSALAPGEARLWFSFEDEITDPKLLAGYRALLTEEEQARHDRYVFAPSRHEYLVTRALARWALSQCTGHPPEAFEFATNAWGKPEIAGPEDLRKVRFNLSNTRGMVACLVALDLEVGVDVEDTTRKGESVEIADRFFSAAEVAELRALPGPMQRDRFFDYWTLKEAYIKCVGKGMAIPLDWFTIVLADESRASLVVSRRPDEGPGYQLRLFRPSPRHRMATAVRTGGRSVPIVPRRIVPFAP